MATNKKSKKEGMPLWLCNTIIIALAVLLVLGCTYQILNTTGTIASITLHSQKAMESENYTMTGADLTYFTYLQYNNVVNTYTNYYGSSYLSYFGIDTSLPLSQQKYNTTTTWRDYCASAAEATVKEYLVLCEAARIAGVELDEADRSSIEASIQELKAAANAYSVSANKFVSSNYGKGVKLEDVQKCYEISALARKYYDIIYNSFEYSDEDIEKYYNDNKNDFNVADYRYYEFKSSYAKDATDEQKAAALEKAKAEAEKFLAALSDGGDFVELVFEIESAKQEAEEEKKDSEDTAAPDTTEAAADTTSAEDTTGAPSTEQPSTTEEPTTTEDDDKITKEDVEESTLKEGAGYTDDELGKWLFADTPAAEGETKMISGTESYIVYKVLKSAYRYDYNTIDVGHVYFYSEDKSVKTDTLKEQAEAFLAKFKEGEMTLEAFEKLVEDEQFTYAVYNGKLEKLSKKGDDVIDGWLFSDERKANDVSGVLDSEKNGVNIFFYLDKNDAMWKTQVDTAKRTEDYETEYKSLEEKHTVTVDNKVMKKIAA